MISIGNDVSTLTAVSEKNLNKIISKAIYCICEAIEESELAGKDVTDLDIGLGTLHIKHVGDEISYKFIPSKTLNKAVINTVVNKLNLLEATLEKSLANKLETVYKDLC